MKKKVLAMFMAALVTVGTVLAPVETGSVYAAQITEEQTEEITPETETELQKEGKYVIIRICQQLYFSDTLFS